MYLQSGERTIKILHIDIETAPNIVYCWGLWNQNVSIKQILDSGYTLCFAYKWHKKRGVGFHSIFEDGEEAMIQRAWELLEEADVVTHYNGTRFDIPTLNKEFVLHGLTPPAPFKQVDLLRTVRRQFKFPSNKLDYVAQTLGIGAKVKHLGMDLWIGCMNGDSKAWNIMKRYNKADVRLLEKLYVRLLPWIPAHPNGLLFDETSLGERKWRGEKCSRCGSGNVQKRGFQYTRSYVYQRYHCTSCGSWMRERFSVIDRTRSSGILLPL